MTGYSFQEWRKWLRNITPLLLGSAGILAAAWAVWLNLNIAGVGNPRRPSPLQVQSESQPGIVIDLPDYLTGQSSNFLSRYFTKAYVCVSLGMIGAAFSIMPKTSPFMSRQNWSLNHFREEAQDLVPVPGYHNPGRIYEYVISFSS